MVNGLIGRKIGMTEVFDEESTMIVATVVEAGPCYVVGKRILENDGYNAVQLAFEETKPQKLNKPSLGNFNKSKVPPHKHLKEFKTTGEDYNLGDIVNVDLFKAGDLLDVTGVSKGKGFSGVMKRHGFSGQPASHGGMAHRRPGSIGQASYPARVWKGIKMPGRMGGVKSTLQGVKVIEVIPEKNIILLKGSIPGKNGGTLILKHTSKGVN